ncbi:hypothetical protein FA15DRAFT_701181 [Coprinopsis marcescibilis]|uniref:Uncharacterized protein n=1 Tax=Coprinopsis marcescibilis TaxID=230819 RepID=A0A5C3L6M1_COPMA|nr:hypothetical protein FA15DRAFT_701181 [Coprinopsis marcescibilis]
MSSTAEAITTNDGETIDLNEDVVWTTAKSRNGVSFEIGTLKSAGAGGRGSSYAELQSEAAEPGSVEIIVGVDWYVTKDDNWKDVSQEVKNIGISRYYLTNSLHPLFEYVLGFTNTKGWGFVFGDRGGDLYTCTTDFNGDHLFRYNSLKPTIRSVA